MGPPSSLGAEPVGAEPVGAEPWSIPYVPTATETDIFFCFRLLLGRSPHREEWRGHATQTGEMLEGVVASYVGSLEFMQRRLARARVSQDLRRVRLDGFSIVVSPSDAAVGRHVADDNYEREVTAVVRRLLRPGMGVIDIGANIGYFTMLSASIVGAEGFVLAVEPNPDNARLLEASRRLNDFGQVLVSQTAAGRDTGLLVLNASHSNGTTSAPPANEDDLLACRTVPSVRVDALLPPARRIHLIKVDVEGAEYNALVGCSGMIERDRPIIVSEFSPDLMPGISGLSGPDYLRWLAARGYALSVIEPDGALRPAPGANSVMAAYHERGVDHIDIVATPDA